jgi:hypothetical protein
VLSTINLQEPAMHPLLMLTPLAAAGYSLVYLLGGGGLLGAIVIYVVAKAAGK